MAQNESPSPVPSLQALAANLPDDGPHRLLWTIQLRNGNICSGYCHDTPPAKERSTQSLNSLIFAGGNSIEGLTK